MTPEQIAEGRRLFMANIEGQTHHADADWDEWLHANAPALLDAAEACERFRAMAFLPRGTSPADIAEHYNTVLRSHGYPENSGRPMSEARDAAFGRLEEDLEHVKAERDAAYELIDRATKISGFVQQETAADCEGCGCRSVGIDEIVGRLVAERDAALGREAQLADAVVWALGYTDFPPREPHEGPYWWRSKLRSRAGLTNPAIEAAIRRLDARLDDAAGARKEADDAR